MRWIKHKGKWDGGWGKWENYQNVFGTLFSSEKMGVGGKYRNGLGKLLGTFLEEGNIPKLGKLFLLDLGILGVAVFRIEARIPGNEFKPHNKEENPKHFQLSNVDYHPGICLYFCVWKSQIPGLIRSRWNLTLLLSPLQIKDFSLQFFPSSEFFPI